jgi:hypothetical protein
MVFMLQVLDAITFFSGLPSLKRSSVPIKIAVILANTFQI